MNIFKEIKSKWDKEKKYTLLRVKLYTEWKTLRDELTFSLHCRKDSSHVKYIYHQLDCRVRAMGRITMLRNNYIKL